MTTPDQLDFLERRKQWLLVRIKDAEARGQNASYDRQELGALEAVTDEVRLYRLRRKRLDEALATFRA